MILARVSGQIVATIKHASYVGQRLLMLDVIRPDGSATGDYLVAVDHVNARDGQTVLVVDEGSSARLITGNPKAPLRSIIVGIVDDVAMRSA